MDQNSYKPIQRIKDTQPIRATCFHPSGETYVVGTNSKALKICKYPEVEERQRLRESSDPNRALPHPQLAFTCLHIHCASVYCATFNPAGDMLATGSNDQIVHIIKYNQDRHAPEGSEYKLTMHNGTVRDVCFLHSSDAKLLSAGAGDYGICLTDCNIMKPIHSFDGHSATVMSLTSCEDSTDFFVSGSLDGSIKLWDTRTKRATSTVTAKQQRPRKQASPPTGPQQLQQQIVAVDGDSSFDLSYQVAGTTMEINGTIDEFHDCDDGLQQQENKWPLDNLNQQQAPMFDTNTTRHIRSNSSKGGVPVGVVRLEPTGRLLVSGHQDGSCMLHDVRADRTIQSFQAHDSEIRTLEFSPNSHYLLTGSYDQRIKLTDLQGQLSLPLPSAEAAQLDDKVVQLAWHPRDYNFVSTCADGSATLWMVPDFDDWRDSVVMDASVII